MNKTALYALMLAILLALTHILLSSNSAKRRSISAAVFMRILQFQSGKWKDHK
jgi:hypothetical protein